LEFFKAVVAVVGVVVIIVVIVVMNEVVVEDVAIVWLLQTLMNRVKKKEQERERIIGFDQNINILVSD
jgi:hypothetical protein